MQFKEAVFLLNLLLYRKIECTFSWRNFKQNLYLYDFTFHGRKVTKALF
ncbi:hypothetical protein ACIN8IBEIGE_100185 [Acinetobacter sp. 8I-beige]|nr:hypothetical protein ACIN8IBEIGE_100185 [Acinetobacter sp. 8I-beige]